MNYDEYTERQQHIAENLRLSGWQDDKIEYELPAVERIVDDLEGVKPFRYSPKNKPNPNSYIAKSTKGIGVANALLDNLSQRVMGELDIESPNFRDARPVDIARAIAVGAESIKGNQGMWQGLGIMNKYYSDSDVIESRYAMSAKMLNQYVKTHPFPKLDGFNSPCAVCPDNSFDFSTFVELFREWMDSMEYYMNIISREIDRTIGAPTTRIKHLKVYMPEGDKSDITDLDLSHFNQITADSLATFATSPLVAALSLDDMTMYEQYIEETRKYIDVFVLDKSGSMSGVRILQAASYLYNRLQKVVDGFAIMAIVTFSSGADIMTLPSNLAKDKPNWLIDTPEKAKWAQINVVKKYTSALGSSTDIPAGVTLGVSLAHKMEQHGGILPNITVVTDDDTSITELDADDIDIPVNGLAIASNDELQDFVVSTGGSYNNLEQIYLNVLQLEKEGA